MREKFALFALCVMSSCAASALSQEKPTTAKKSVKTNSTAPKPATEVANPVLKREQAAFKAWAKAMRETSDAAAKLPERRRDAWYNKTWKAKEDKIRLKLRLESVPFYELLKRGLMAKWPTESAADLDKARAILDPLILKDEVAAWTREHMPRRHIPSGGDFRSAIEQIQNNAADDAAKMPKVPIALCCANKKDGKRCNRETVGGFASMCYEHR